MEKPDVILQTRLEAIHAEFHHALGDKLAGIKDLWRKARAENGDLETIRLLRSLVVELETSGAPLKQFRIADLAHKLGKILNAIPEKKQRLTEIRSRQIDLLISLLESATENPDPDAGRPARRRWQPVGVLPDIPGIEGRIFILDTHLSWAESLSGAFPDRYQIRLFHRPESLVQALAEDPPRLIITDTPLGDRNLPARYPLIYIAAHDKLEARLTAVRTGAAEFYTLPLEIARLADKAQELITGAPSDPFRVMIIENDAPLAEFYGAILGQEGMQVTIVTEPGPALEVIRDKRPELILIKLDLPELSGVELTRIIRQEKRHAGIAILFLAAEWNLGERMAAITSGGDDFISIPVDPDHLAQIVSARLFRARTLNAINHSLTAAFRELENQQFALNQHAIVCITNVNGVIIHVNDKLCEISGYTRSELVGRDRSILHSGLHDRNFYQEMWSTIESGKVWQGDVCNRKKNGDRYWTNTTIVPFLDEQSRPYQYVSINSDITTKKFIEQDLMTARDAAVNASQAKSDFISKISHEQRAPLNAVLGFSQILSSGKDGALTEGQMRHVNEIRNAGRHLLRLLNDALDLSRIEANQITTDSVDIPLTALLDECVALIQPGANLKRINISTRYRYSADVTVIADPLRLKQVLVNLLSNAVKYNKPDGLITVVTVLLNDAGMAAVHVTDTGAGISPDQMEKLFMPFTRLPQHEKEEGAGIGLALSKRLIELMGGRIGARSSAGGQTTFWIEIPMAKRGFRNGSK